MSGSKAFTNRYFQRKEYEKNNGNAEDFAWYLESAAWSGNTEAMELLSRCYAEGKGTEKDLAKASFWYERAVRRGTPTREDPAKNLDEKEKQKEKRPKSLSKIVCLLIAKVMNYI